MTGLARKIIITLTLPLCFSIKSVVFANEPDNTGKLLKSFNAVFLNPGFEDDDTFWGFCDRLMNSVTEDLDINLEIRHVSRSQVTALKTVDAILKSETLPDVILMQNMKETAGEIIQKTHEKGIKVFLFNSGISERSADFYGKPREKHRHWIGELIPDDEAAGYELARILFNAAIDKQLVNSEGKVEMIAIGGTVSDTSAIAREKGLIRFANENSSKLLLHRNKALPANWSAAIAEKISADAYSFFPETNVVWAANDNMATGAIKSLKQTTDKQPGKDILFGSIDWTSEGIDALLAGELETSLGGHISECVWSLVLLYDYFNGFDFKDTIGVSMSSYFVGFPKENRDKLLSFLKTNQEAELSKVDFKAFTKAINGADTQYEFSFVPIVEQE